jgi:hypothetical protein
MWNNLTAAPALWLKLSKNSLKNKSCCIINITYFNLTFKRALPAIVLTDVKLIKTSYGIYKNDCV